MMNPALNRILGAALAAATLTTSLSGCVPLVVGGAVVGGGMLATDRRTTGAQVEDEGIELRAANRIREQFGDRVHVNVTSYNRKVLLSGEVPTAQDRQQVEQLAAGIENVRGIVNDLGVMTASTLGQRSTDTLITGKVRASFVDAPDLLASVYKVVTERSVVYLMGRVTQREAQRATEITRGVDGVAKVVRLFDIISEDELRRAAPATSTGNSPANNTK